MVRRAGGRVTLAPFVGPIGLCVDSRAADAPDATHDLSAGIGRDETGRDPNQHGAGGVVNQTAMIAALKSGRLAGAGLDVTDPEPIARRDPLLRLDNVVITPHIGSASIATRASMAAIAVDNILDVFAGRMPRCCANAAVRLRP